MVDGSNFFSSVKFFSKNFFDQKIIENVFFGPNGEKMANSKIFGQIFFLGIDLECFETYFIMKISKSKIFHLQNFNLGLNHFLTKMVKYG